MIRAWTFVIVGLNLGLLFLAFLVAGAANSLGVFWKVGFILVGAVYLLLGTAILSLIWHGGRSALLEEVGGSLIFAGSVCLLVAGFMPWLQRSQLFPFQG
jgi:xanthine/uracil permease